MLLIIDFERRTMENNLLELKRYLDRLSEDMGWCVIISDYYGVLRENEIIGEYLSSRRWHTNPYCMKVKENRQLWDRCIDEQNTRRIDAQNRKKGGFFVCYCGVAGYTLPVFLGNVHAFTVEVTGFFASGMQQAEEKVASMTGSPQSEVALLRKKHLEPITDIQTSRLECYVGVIGQMLNNIFAEDPLLTSRYDEESAQRKYVLDALDYIDKYYCEELSIKDVARHCNVSSSYLQHLFVEYTKEGIATAIRRKRMEYACELLISTGASVQSIAMSCGFYDTNYFSVAFKRIYGTTPLKFRKNRINRLG